MYEVQVNTPGDGHCIHTGNDYRAAWKAAWKFVDTYPNWARETFMVVFTSNGEEVQRFPIIVD